MANEWLVDHAIQHVWCQPSIDARFLVKPARLSPPEGEVYGMVVSEHSIRLPKEETWFHVFQIGSFDPKRVGVSDAWAGWVRADVLVNKYNTHIQLYNDTGRTLPLSLAYFRVLENHNLIVALEMYDLQADFSTDDLYIRFYDGKFKYSAGYLDDYRSFTNSKVVRNGEEIFNIVVEYQATQNLPGYTFAFINGYAVPELTLDNVKVWDYVEYFHDGMVKELITFTAGNLSTFSSALDMKRKYVLHPPKSIATIDFTNDVELFVFNGADGRYYNQHTPDSLRQLTHRDYAIPTAKLQDFVSEIDSWSNIDKLKVKLFIRRSGLERPVEFESHRIRELYKLSDQDILRAFSGTDAVLVDWQAAELEQSAYVRLMAAKHVNITNDLCTRAYGYNAISSMVAMTPQQVVNDNGQSVVTLPPLLARSCTVYEYDINGKLLGWYPQAGSASDLYICTNAACALVEVIEGIGTKQIDVNYNAAIYQVEAGLNYRFYTDVLISGVPSGNYTDVTGTNAYSIDDQGVVAWNVDLTRRLPIIVSDKQFLAYEFTEDGYDGLLEFSIAHYRSDLLAERALPFQPEKVELWLDGRTLTPGLDYVLNWPRVTICNKSYLADTSVPRHSPKITVRCRGVAESVIVPAYGFVVNGLLSNNNRFDVRDDKVIRLSIDGKINLRNAMNFREDLGVLVDNGMNGKPYFVDDPTIPLRTITDANTYTLRDEARVIDARVEAYLTNMYPTPNVAVANPIASKHMLFSPFLNKLVHDLIHNILLPVEDDTTHYISTVQFDALLAPYLYLVECDPVVTGVDQRYVEIHPHDGMDYIELTPIQYAIIERANFRYLRNEVVLNKLLKVKV